uniref:Uncharacterized protein n=1 Tax=Myoviridae sp. ctZ2t4 TaxID=2827693 RepID=A0A8S5SS42_9CAUD|nr:MAG TPA: hypothetical protein [Myoviridae sp. ctZ2t4]
MFFYSYLAFLLVQTLKFMRAWINRNYSAYFI